MLKRSVIIGLAATAFIASAVANASFLSVAQLLATMQREASAWSVQIKQTAVAASQQNAATLRSAQTVSTANEIMLKSNRIVDATRDYSPRFGQPDELKCAAQANRVVVLESFSQRDKDLSAMMQSYSSSRVGSQAVANQTKLSTRKSSFCSQDEAKAGVCELVPNGMQAWDSNYAGAFNELTLAPETELAGYEYVAMVTDNRSSAFADCKSAACDAAAHKSHAATAFSSMAAFSLAGQIADRRMTTFEGE